MQDCIPGHSQIQRYLCVSQYANFIHRIQDFPTNPGSRVWDIDLTKATERPEYNAFPVEAALLREVFACRVLAYATDRVVGDRATLNRRKRNVDSARKHALQSPEEDTPQRQVLLDDATRIRLVRVHHQSMISKQLS